MFTGHPHWNVPPGAEPVPSGVPSFGYVQVTGAARARFRAFVVGGVSRNVYVPSAGRMSLITYWPWLSVTANGSLASRTPLSL